MKKRILSAVKPFVFDVFGSEIFLSRRLKKIRNANILTILNLHRVDDRATPYEALSPKLFEELVIWLKGRFDIVTFGDLDEGKPGKKPQLILSFDDGYKDFIDIVMPILARHDVRANQNVIPGCIENGRPPMNVILGDFIATAPAALLRETALPGLPDGVDTNKRTEAALRASAALKSRPIVEQKKIFSSLEPQLARFDGFKPTAMMSLDEVRQATTVHEIGMHSFEHASMQYETDGYLQADAAKCMDYGKERLGATPNIYAFPNGSAREEQIHILKEAGFSKIFLVGEDFSNRDSSIHSRFTIYAASQSEARFRSLGGFKRIEERNTIKNRKRGGL